MTYKEKLLDPRWQKKRLEILNRDEFMCQSCGDTTSTLHVHHKYYENIEPWDYSINSLITLCADCHEQESFSEKQYSNLIIDTLKKSKFLADDWRELAYGIHEMQFNYHPELLAKVYGDAFRNDDVQNMLVDNYLKLKN